MHCGLYVTSIRFTGKESLVVLGREVHVVVGQRLLLGGGLEAQILCSSEQVQGVPPDLVL